MEMEEDEPVSSSEAQQSPTLATAHGAGPVDTRSGPRNTLQNDIWYAQPHSGLSEIHVWRL